MENQPPHSCWCSAFQNLCRDTSQPHVPAACVHPAHRDSTITELCLRPSPAQHAEAQLPYLAGPGLWFFREVLWHPRWPCIGPSDMWEIPDDVPVLLATKQARCMATIPRKCSPSSPARKIAMLYAGLPSFHTLPQQSVQIQHLHESIEIEENTSPF